MKQPIFKFVFGFTVTLYIVFYFIHLDVTIEIFQEHSILILTIEAVILCIGLWWKPIRSLWIIEIGIICGLAFFHVYQTYMIEPVQLLAGTSHTFIAEIQDYPKVYEEEQRVEIRISPEQLGMKKNWPYVQTLIYLPLTDDPLYPGDEIKVSADFYVTNVSDGFQRQEYYAANGFHIFAKYTISENGDIPIYFAYSHPDRTNLKYKPLFLAQRLKDTIHSFMNDRQSGFVCAILFGDKSALEKQDSIALKKAGLSHLVAISGMHIGFLVGFCVLLFGKRLGSILSIVFILCFIPMAGCSPSVIRAGIMYCMTSLAFLFRRENSGLNDLSVALFILLIQNPYAIRNLSLILSFASSLGLLLFGERCQTVLFRPFHNMPKPVKRIAYLVVSSISCSFCTMLFTLPITLNVFGYVSVFAPLSNFLVVHIIGAIFILSAIMSMIGTVLPTIGYLFTFILSPLIHYVLTVAGGIADFPYGLIYGDNVYTYLAFAFLCTLLALLILCTKYKKCIFGLPFCIIAMVLSVGVSIQQENQLTSIHILPSGAGQTIAITSMHRKLILIDCAASGFRNASENVDEFMQWYGYDKIDTLILTAVDITHARSVPELLTQQEIGQIVIPKNVRESEVYSQIQFVAAQENIPITIFDEQNNASLSLSFLTIIDDIDRKLIIRLETKEGDMLILHSLTQKMLATWLEGYQGYAELLVLSERNIEDGEALLAAIKQLHATELILQSGYSRQQKILGLPVKNTYVHGEIIIHL